MEITQLITLGLIVGFLSSFFGIGGGSLIVPILYGLYPKLPASVVISTSLGSIFCVTFINSIKYAKLRQLPPKEIALNLIVTCTVGAFTGSLLLQQVNTQMAKFSMAIILLLMCGKLLFFKNNPKKLSPKNTPHLIYAFTGLVGAFISSLTGLGGGIIFTPIFINILKVPTKLVAPYSNLAMAITSFVGLTPLLLSEVNNAKNFSQGLLQYGFIGSVNIALVGIITLAAFISSSQGIKYNNRVLPRTKERILAILLLIFSLKLFLS